MRLLLAALLTLPICVPGCMAQLDADNWGKGSPGVQLAAHESSRQHTEKGTAIWYNLLGKGFPDGVVYNLWRKLPGKQPEVLIKGVSFDQRGLLICSGKPGFCSGDTPDDPVNIKTTAAMGEEKQMAVVSEDGKTAGYVDVVPFPLETANKGCKLSVTRVSPLADVVMARASGLKPDQMIVVTRRYGHDHMSARYTSRADGTWQEIVSAQNTYQPSGKAEISLSGADCEVSVTFDYGPGSNKPQ